MNQSIGVNLSKVIDNLNKKVKVPAITQRQYYKECCDNEDDDYINIYNDSDFKDDKDEYKEYSYLDDDNDDQYEEIQDDYDDEYSCSCCNLDKKAIGLITIGTVVGIMGLYILFKRGSRRY